MKPFEFHGELFEMRGIVLDALATNGFVWLSDFSSVDLAHDTYGLEVTGIRDPDRATQIHRLLRTLFPGWLFHQEYYEQENLAEVGWNVIISRDPEQPGDDFLPSGCFEVDPRALEERIRQLKGEYEKSRRRRGRDE